MEAHSAHGSGTWTPMVFNTSYRPAPFSWCRPHPLLVSEDPDVGKTSAETELGVDIGRASLSRLPREAST